MIRDYIFKGNTPKAVTFDVGEYVCKVWGHNTVEGGLQYSKKTKFAHKNVPIFCLQAQNVWVRILFLKSAQSDYYSAC